MVPHTFKQQGHLASIKEKFIQRLVSVPVFPLVSANDACCTHFFFFNVDTLCSMPLSDTLNLWLQFHLSLSLFLSLSSCPSFALTFAVFVWPPGFVCLLFPDGRRRLHLSSFQVPREIFYCLGSSAYPVSSRRAL